jgi:hypothetical protein
MAINLTTNTAFDGRRTAADANYPYSSAKDETSPGAGDGSPHIKVRADDVLGLHQALLRAASIVPSGNADNAVTSQYMQCLTELISGRAFNYTDSGAADAYVLSVNPNQHAPQSLHDGLTVWFVPSAVNTGASTVNPVGLGVTDIKLRGGSIDPSAGMIDPSRVCKLTYRSAPSGHFELDLTGFVLTQEISVSGTYTPTPGTKAILIEITGGGGGGGGVDGGGAGAFGCSVSGAGAGTSIKLVLIISSSYTIVIGAGGLGGPAGNNNGTAGGTTTIVDDDTGAVVNMAASGGAGGLGILANAPATLTAGAVGGTSTGGDINLAGRDSTSASDNLTRTSLSLAGASYFGGGRCATLSVNGLDGINPGEGGTGTSSSNEATNYAGGDGQDGIVRITEFF